MTAGRGLSNSRLEGVNALVLSTSGRSASGTMVAQYFQGRPKYLYLLRKQNKNVG